MNKPIKKTICLHMGYLLLCSKSRFSSAPPFLHFITAVDSIYGKRFRD